MGTAAFEADRKREIWANTIEEESFERRLREDLPRGHMAQARSTGRERALSARWLSSDEMTGDHWRAEGSLLLGRRAGRLLGWNDDRHVMTIAGSRAGKGVSLIIPNLQLYEGSALVVDPKGENARMTAARRATGVPGGVGGLNQDVHVLDPFGVSEVQSSCFNPLDELNPESEDFIEDAGMFADALITHPDQGERHWTESAQAVLRALILVAAGDTDPDRRNLVTVRKLLMLTDEQIRDRQMMHPPSLGTLEAQEALIQILMAEDVKPYGYVCFGVAEQLRAMGENERGSVLSAARTQTQWLDSPKIHRLLSKSDFKLADLKRRKMTVYLCLPAMRMGTHAKWFRLMILLALSLMERTQVKPPAPVLFVLDEFPILGHVEVIEKAAGLMAGFGVKLWVIVQNLGQLKQHYNKAWQTFFANAGVVTAFGVADQETLRELSAKLGRMRTAEQVRTGAAGHAMLSGSAAFRDDHFDVPLLAEHELSWIFGREQKRMLILAAGLQPAIAERLEYFEEPMFDGMYEKDR
jgi:type IV secretion system protein VirD4